MSHIVLQNNVILGKKLSKKIADHFMSYYISHDDKKEIN